MKVKPEYYPVILIAAFFAGLIIAMALGFRPAYGSHEERAGRGSQLIILPVSGVIQGPLPWQ